MPPIILWLLQGFFLLLLYIFVWRAVRAVVRDLRTAPAPPRPARTRRPAAEPAVNDAPRRATPSQLVVHFPNGRPRVIELTNEAVLFGRSPSSTVRLDDPYVSDDHARIYRSDSDGGWMIADLKSTNGTFLNRVKVTAPAQIAAGDQLGIGKTIVEVRK